MASLQTQHRMFAFQAMPILFHNQTAQFQALIKRDGLDFLKFWWDRVGLNFPEEQRHSPEGLNWQVHPYKDGREIFIIRMPTPKIEEEAYFLAMVTRPLKRSILPWRNLARVFVVTMAKSSDEEPETAFGELTRSARLVPVQGRSPKANAKSLLDRVVSILDSKK